VDRDIENPDLEIPDRKKAVILIVAAEGPTKQGKQENDS
jgi:hypothetical protein